MVLGPFNLNKMDYVFITLLLGSFALSVNCCTSPFAGDQCQYEYKLYKSSNKINRVEAISLCLSEFGGVLAKVDSAVDSASLKVIFDANSMGSRKVWIGAELTSGGSWGQWYHDGSPLTWTNWVSSPGSKDKVYLEAHTMEWSDESSNYNVNDVACMIVCDETTTVQTTEPTTVQTTEPTTVLTTEATTVQPCDQSQLDTLSYALKMENKAVNNLANAFIGKFTTRSKLECATKCLKVPSCSCHAFIFNKSDKSCTLLESKIPLSDFVVDVQSVSYYEINGL
ncbi:unnamed protein product [Owenia fusiformis]|uniref:C-type lectin domain-containing protein n=1 Tax=Owenia fusiformis TaxID=6347 RepID=A0A8S4N7V2_OWEFU|nr:unnamed protein product [Owenia fusiformis]